MLGFPNSIFLELQTKCAVVFHLNKLSLAQTVQSDSILPFIILRLCYIAHPEVKYAKYIFVPKRLYSELHPLQNLYVTTHSERFPVGNFLVSMVLVYVSSIVTRCGLL